MAGNGGQVRVTPDDRGPILAIITWLFLVMMILAVLSRIVIKYAVRRSLGLDDYTVCAALVFGVTQSIVISISIQNGLGQRKTSLGSDRLTEIEQTLYAANLFFVMACSLAKISIFLLLQRLAVSRIHKMTMKISIYIIIAWAVSSLLSLAFQCGVPQPWSTQNGHCYDMFLFWLLIGVVDIISELMIMGLPIFMMLPVQIATSKKITVIICFLFRISVFSLICVRLAFLHSYQSADDFVFESLSSGIITQILISVSITTACVPALKPFLDSFESGALGVKLKHSNGNGGSHSYELPSNNNLKLNKSALRSVTQEADGDRQDGTGYLAAISGHGSRRVRNTESDSFESGKSDAMIIRRTDHWTVEYDENDTEATNESTRSGGEGGNES